MKRVFMIHGWDGAPEEGWRPWLIKQLEPQGFVVTNLAMPNPKYPKQQEWVNFLTKQVGSPDEQSYFIGHSLGCIATLRYLESLEYGENVGGVLLVAGFDDDLGIPELSDFFKTPIEWEKIKSHSKHFISLESDNDPYELAKYNEVFREKLQAEIFLAHGMKHFSGDDGITEAPIVLEKFLQLTENK